jgi:protein MPE1
MNGCVPGHWIQDCPTNDKPEWDNKPRIKRTTGIPKSFLQTVEGPTKDGENQAGVMITAEGGFVIARPDA